MVIEHLPSARLSQRSFRFMQLPIVHFPASWEAAHLRGLSKSKCPAKVFHIAVKVTDTL